MNGEFTSQGHGRGSGSEIASVEDKREAFERVLIEKQSKLSSVERDCTQVVNSAGPEFASSLAAELSTKATLPSANLQSSN
jgi:hypothetical protein